MKVAELALTEEMVEAALAQFYAGLPLADYPVSARDDMRAALTAVLSLSHPAADRRQEACPFCGGDELNLADNEYRSRVIARLNNIVRGQIVEECAQAVSHCVALDENGYICEKSTAMKAIYALSRAPAQTEE